MAVTHADLAPATRCRINGSKTRMMLMLISILLGLLCFVLCLIAEATRSQIVRDGERSESCRYSGNGKTPLICAAAAFLSLAIAMVVQHTHLLLSVASAESSSLLIMDNQHLTWQAAFFFFTTWICFSTGEVVLLIGLSVESGHLKGWLTPRRSCFIAREGLFSSAGVLGITTVFLASGLSITAHQWLLLQDQQQNIADASNNSPPATATSAAETSTPVHDLYQYDQPAGLIDYLRAFDKII